MKIEQIDERNFADVYKKYRKILCHRGIHRHGLSNSQAEDAYQSTLEKVWKSRHTFDVEVSTFDSWVSRIHHNTVIDMHRRATKVPVDDSLEVQEVMSDFEDDSGEICGFNLTLQSERKMILDELQQTLGNKRDVFRLFFEEDMTHSEIQSTLNIPLGTVKSRLRNGMDQIAKKLEGMDL